MNSERKYVPYTTAAGVQIGRMYLPKPTIRQAQCIEVYSRPSYIGRWLAVCGLALLAAFLVVRIAA
jgi:hypothetical protein